MRAILAALAFPALAALYGCGGGGGDGGSAAAAAPAAVEASTEQGSMLAAAQAAPDGANAASASDALPVVVDSGPLALLFYGRRAVNMLYATVTVCTSGSTTACETIPHVLVDTGSVGLRLLSTALSGKAALQALADTGTGSPLRECVQFADGHTWGSVATADVRIGGRTLRSLPLNVIGDPAAGAVPPSCASGPNKSSIASFGANGVLGVGSFLHDCGPACVGSAVPGTYYLCPSAGAGALCRPAAVPLGLQVPNPVAALGSGNNGLSITIAPVPRSGSGLAKGSLRFGVDSAALGPARLYTLDGHGTLLTSFGGRSRPAVVDTGTNAYVFASDSLATCLRNAPFYCPSVGGTPVSSSQSAAIVGRNGLSANVDFIIDNIDEIFSSQSVLPGLGAPSSEFLGDAASLFAWGLPFFFGRTVHVLFEGKELGGITGPAIGF